MNKLRQPPIFTIEDTTFLVDTDRQVLRQTNDPGNEISFINHMQDHGTHYRLLYDLDAHCAAEDLFDQTRVKVIDIPQLTELDPEGMSEKYSVPVDQLAGKTDFEVIVDQQLLTARHNGIMPQIRIMDDCFHVVLKAHELWPAGHWGPNINLGNLTISDDGSCYEGYYHPVLKSVVEIDAKLIELPDHIVRIKIPHELRLDPVFAAQIYGMDEREVLRRHPIQKELKAGVIPLSETHIPALIRQNREQLQQAHKENARRAKPRIRPRF